VYLEHVKMYKKKNQMEKNKIMKKNVFLS